MQAQLFPSKEMKIELLRHDLFVTDIARYLGVGRSTVSNVIHNYDRTPWIRLFLERLLDDMRVGEFSRLEDYRV